MVTFYVCQIKLNRMTIGDVPEKWREAVRKQLDI